VITYKSPREIALMRDAGRVVAEILDALGALCLPGRTTEALDAEASRIIVARGATALFKGYRGYPATVCVSVNEEVVHGIPGPRLLDEGDIVSVDVGVKLAGYCADAARTFPVGRVTEARRRLLRVTEEALGKAIEAVRPKGRLSSIAAAVQDHAEANGYGVVRKFVGHGIGRELHEDPQVPNFRWDASENYERVLRPGLVIAIEPMVNEGTHEVDTLANGWTVVTRDRGASAHFEHTVAVTENGHEILTLP
jgi:methionyl aminopeptidase